MDDYGQWDMEEEDEMEDAVPEGVVYKPSYILIAVDTSPSMFATDDDKRSPFMNCLEACYELSNSLVMADRSSIKAPLAIVFAENEAERANFIEFGQSIPETIALLKDLKNQLNETLKAKYERKCDFDLASFFLLCKNKLVSINTDVYQRTVLYITNDDNPTQNDRKKKFKAINESQKFPSLQMNLLVCTFNEEFESDNLYSEILTESNSPPIEHFEGTSDLNDKLTTLFQRKYKKFRYKLFPFKENYDSYIEVVVNRFVQSNRIAKNMHVTRDTQKEVKKSFGQETTGNYECQYAKTNVEPLVLNGIEKENVMETNLPVGFTLLYVAEESLEKNWVVEPAVLMEKNNKESLPIFESFWEFCREKSKCLVCLRKYKKCGNATYVEMTPKYINKTRMFLVKALPFANEIYHLPSVRKENIKCKDAEEAVVAGLVDALTFEYKAENFKDPVLCKKEAYIKSQILEEPIQTVLDGMLSDEQIDERILHQMKKLEALGLTDQAQSEKRANTSSHRGGYQKKLKAEK